jgi:hypothetical protein
LDVFMEVLVKAMVNEHVFGDISDEFEFDEASMDYVDAPLSGWIQRKSDGQWFAFDCQPVVAQLVWHWTLVTTAVRSDVREVLERAAAEKEGCWLSIIEDRRTSAESTCRLAPVENGKARPVVCSVRARPRSGA